MIININNNNAIVESGANKPARAPLGSRLVNLRRAARGPRALYQTHGSAPAAASYLRDR